MLAKNNTRVFAIMIFVFDLEAIIQTTGYLGLFAIIFAETGLFIGFFLPGDSLLFTAGLLASQGLFNIALLCLLLFIAAVLGDSTGYFIGHRFGKKLFNRGDSLFFHKDHLIRASNFYKKHGGKTIILARFMPIIRTFAPVVAGIGTMEYRRFLTYNIIGAALWTICIPVAGYFLGRVIPDVDKFLIPIITIIVLISISPGIYEVLNTAQKRKRLVLLIKNGLFKSNHKSNV